MLYLRRKIEFYAVTDPWIKKSSSKSLNEIIKGSLSYLPRHSATGGSICGAYVLRYLQKIENVLTKF